MEVLKMLAKFCFAFAVAWLDECISFSQVKTGFQGKIVSHKSAKATERNHWLLPI